MKVMLGGRTDYGELSGEWEEIDLSPEELQAKLDGREWYECSDCQDYDDGLRTFHPIHPDDMPGVDTRWLILVNG